MSGRNGVPGWLVFVGSTVVALVLVVGIVTLLVLGRPVPDQLWIIAASIGVAYFGAGPFSLMSQHQANASAQASTTTAALVDTVNHAIATLREAVAGTTGAAMAAQTHGAPPPTTTAGSDH